MKEATLMAGRFGSVVTAMVTPFREDHALDLDGAQELASWLVGNGSDSVVVAGSTGESPTVTHKEKADLFRAVSEAITGTGKLICGTGLHSTAETLSPLFNALFVTSNPIPLKAALQMVGRSCGEPRLPLVPATSDERDRVRKALEDAGLLG